MECMSSPSLDYGLTLTKRSYCNGYISDVAPPGFAELVMSHRGHNNQQSPYIPYPAQAHIPQYHMPSQSVVDTRQETRHGSTVPQMHIQPEARSNDNNLSQVPPVVPLPHALKERDMRERKPALKHAGKTLQGSTQGKCVHWKDERASCMDFGKYRRMFVRQSPARHIMTAPFTISFNIGGDDYTVHFEPVETSADLLVKFENELERCVSDHQKAMLRLAISRGYALHFRRPLRTSTTKVDDHEYCLREAAFNGFVNAVFSQASVTMEWL
jgi:hypothetical protein